MNLETKVHAELWAEIRRSYSEARYSDAIKDAIVYLSEVIRSKSGLEGDGVALVGPAFGGANPKIKVSKMESQSEKDVQAGIEAILRGVYLGVRNPRHHGKVNDNADDADAIILFIDYLIRIVGKAKAQFSMSDCLKTAFDDAFVESAQYAELIVSEIPEKHRRDVFVEAFQRVGTGRVEKLKYFFGALFKMVQPLELDEALSIVSKALRSASPKEDLAPILAILREEDWVKLDEIARLRAENALLDSMQDGEYLDATQKCIAGSVGTWGSSFLPHFKLKSRAVQILKSGLLSDNRKKRAYVNKFLPFISELQETPNEWDVKSFTKALNDGCREVQLHLGGIRVFGGEDDPWIKPFIEPLKNFKAKQETASLDEDVPF